MDVKLTLVCVLLMVLAIQDKVQAEFLFNRVYPNKDMIGELGLKCVPGRTIIKMQDKPVELKQKQRESSEEDDRRRSHMRFHTNEEYCQACVCSVDGKDMYCSNRPAMNVNECMMFANVMQQFKKNEPYDHERTLSYMIRRDYIWHKGELPTEPNAKCYRGHSYYSNSINANDTDVDVASDVTSLLDYSNMGICFYCICTVKGDAAGCLARNPWFCEYFRKIRQPDAARDRYRTLFQQDRPAYFRQLSYRLRRTMDDAMFDLIDHGGDTLCCNHPDGHRRQMHHQVRNKIRLLKNKVHKENLMGGSLAGDYDDFIVNND